MRLNACLAARAEEGFKPLVAKGLNHGDIVICNVTAINMKQSPLSSARPCSFHSAYASCAILGGLLDPCLVENPAFNLGVPLEVHIFPPDAGHFFAARASQQNGLEIGGDD